MDAFDYCELQRRARVLRSRAAHAAWQSLVRAVSHYAHDLRRRMAAGLREAA